VIGLKPAVTPAEPEVTNRAQRRAMARPFRTAHRKATQRQVKARMAGLPAVAAIYGGRRRRAADILRRIDDTREARA
jgi:hypothetical protein